MAKSKLVGVVFDAWRDMDRVFGSLDAVTATQTIDGGSSFAWTLAHMTNHLDVMINEAFQKKARHEVIRKPEFSFGGTGTADDWEGIQKAVREVRHSARTYLEGFEEGDLTISIPYKGGISYLQEKELTLQHALIRICVHDYFHIGEVATMRSRLGHDVGDYPGPLLESV